MTSLTTWRLTASAFTIAAALYFGWPARTADAQPNRESTWSQRTPWGDPDCRESGRAKANTVCPSSVHRSSARGPS